MFVSFHSICTYLINQFFISFFLLEEKGLMSDFSSVRVHLSCKLTVFNFFSSSPLLSPHKEYARKGFSQFPNKTRASLPFFLYILSLLGFYMFYRSMPPPSSNPPLARILKEKKVGVCLGIVWGVGRILGGVGARGGSLNSRIRHM